MKIFSIYNAKTHFSRLIKEALSGEEIVIAKGDKPIIKLVVIDQGDGERKIGLYKGKIEISADFDDELTDFKDYMP